MGPGKGCFSIIIVFSNFVQDHTSDIPYLILFDVNIHIICILYVLYSNSFSFPFLSSSSQTLCYLILLILVSISSLTSSSFLFPCGILSVLSLSFYFYFYPLPYPRNFLNFSIPCFPSQCMCHCLCPSADYRCSTEIPRFLFFNIFFLLLLDCLHFFLLWFFWAVYLKPQLSCFQLRITINSSFIPNLFYIGDLHHIILSVSISSFSMSLSFSSSTSVD